MKKLFLISFITLFVIQSYSQTEYKEITVEDLWVNYKFFPKSIDGINSMKDGEHYTVFDNYDYVTDFEQEIIKYEYKTGKVVETIINFTELKYRRVAADYEFNEAEDKLLFYTNTKSIYRHSFTADYIVYDLKTKKTTAVSEKGQQQLATFSPDGNKVAFVRDNNLFIKNLLTSEEKQITIDGKYNEIINGAPDWVYEEEFGFSQAYKWSPDSKNIAFMKFNEKEVSMFNMTKFAGLSPKNQDNVLYPENYTFKYPKAGDGNSIVNVFVYNLKTEKTTKMDIGKEKDQYIPRIRWTKDPTKLSIFRLNRLQNKLEILFANPKTGDSELIMTENNKYYIEDFIYDKILFLEDGKHFVMTSERDGYRHLYLYNINGKMEQQLTKGEWDITDFYGYDEKNKNFYYQSAENSPLEREVYSVSINGENKTKISNKKGTNNMEFSSNYKYYINNFSDINTPPVFTLNSNDKVIKVLEDNKTFKEEVEEYGGINKEFFTFKTSEGVELNAYKIVPPNFDATKKHAVIITQYSGPGSQEVLNHWAYDGFGWENLLAQKGFVIISVDPRGTGARGAEFRKMTYKQLGKYETIDLIETAKYLGTLPYIDKDRIGIWGWSYGGYMVSLCLTKGADYFNTGIAVAPVTNWRYYDNIYTERFMQKPQNNADGYDDNSPINHVDKLEGNLLLIHGSADDNVHLQNTMEFAEALVQANKQFDMMIYNNRNHSIFGGNTRFHLFTLKTNYFVEHLKPEILK